MQNLSDDEIPDLLPQQLFPNAAVPTPVQGAPSDDVFGPTPPPPQPQPFPMPNIDNHIPAQMVSCAQFSAREHHGARGRDIHPSNPHLL